MRRVVRGVGRTLIGAGALLLLFVAYQLWGTGLQEARAQSDLKDDFAAALEAAGADDAPTVADPTTPTTLPLPVPTGEAVAMLRIPALGVEKAVVEGVGVGDLKKGPGHYPDTPLPGQPGNAGIAGHRTTYGAPFYELDRLELGDTIEVTTLQGRFTFEVDRTLVVRPDQVEVLDPTEESRITLTTCHPRYTRSQRLVVSAVLVGQPPAPAPAPAPEAPDEPVAGPSTLDDPAGLSGDAAARGPAIAWGLAAAAAALAVHLVARRRRHPWLVYLAGALPFGIVLFVFFENFSRLLPANF